MAIVRYRSSASLCNEAKRKCSCDFEDYSWISNLHVTSSPGMRSDHFFCYGIFFALPGMSRNGIQLSCVGDDSPRSDCQGRCRVCVFSFSMEEDALLLALFGYLYPIRGSY
ncbi:hypothetical protein AAC387_Pa11g0918 [Persea americana]